MASCLIIVLIIVSLFKVKLAHYSVLAYFPISFFAAYSIRYILEEGKEIKKTIYILFVVGSLIWTACLVLLPITRANLDVVEKYVQEETLHQALSTHYPWENLELFFGVGFFLLFAISWAMLVYRKKKLMGFVILFLGGMLLNNALLLYYVPKIEQLTQGPQVEFIVNNKNEKAYYHYLGGLSYIPKFYSDSALIYSHSFSVDSLQHYSEGIYPHYLISKSVDTHQLSGYGKHLNLLYLQGIYAFYKIK